MPMLKMMARNPSSSPNVSGVQLKNLDLLVSFPSALSFEISVAYLHIQSMDCVASTAHTHTHTHTWCVCVVCVCCMHAVHVCVWCGCMYVCGACGCTCVWCLWVHVCVVRVGACVVHALTRTQQTHHTHTPHTPHTPHTHIKHTCNPNRASLPLRSKECNMTRHCTCALDFGSGK